MDGAPLANALRITAFHAVQEFGSPRLEVHHRSDALDALFHDQGVRGRTTGSPSTNRSSRSW